MNINTSQKFRYSLARNSFYWFCLRLAAGWVTSLKYTAHCNMWDWERYSCWLFLLEYPTLRLSQLWYFKFRSSGLWRRTEVHATSIFKVIEMVLLVWKLNLLHTELILHVIYYILEFWAASERLYLIETERNILKSKARKWTVGSTYSQMSYGTKGKTLTKCNFLK